MRRTLLCALFALALAAPALADEPIASLGDPTPVDAHAGRLVWSERVAGTERFRLTTREGPVPVAERRGPFDVDLGPGGSPSCARAAAATAPCTSC